MINYRDCNLKLHTTDSSTRAIEGYSDIDFVFGSENGHVQVTLKNAAHVPGLRYHVFSLPTLVKHCHAFEGRFFLVVKPKPERSTVFPLTGNLYSLYGYRVNCSTRGDACAVLAPRKLPNKPIVNINDYHCPVGYSHQALLSKDREAARDRA